MIFPTKTWTGRRVKLSLSPECEKFLCKMFGKWSLVYLPRVVISFHCIFIKPSSQRPVKLQPRKPTWIPTKIGKWWNQCEIVLSTMAAILRSLCQNSGGKGQIVASNLPEEFSHAENCAQVPRGASHFFEVAGLLHLEVVPARHLENASGCFTAQVSNAQNPYWHYMKYWLIHRDGVLYVSWNNP